MKFETFNEKGNEKVVLQNEQVLAQLKKTNGHVTQNVFQSWQNVIDIWYIDTPPILSLKRFTPFILYELVNKQPSIPCFSSNTSFAFTPRCKLQMKVEMMQLQSNNIATMAKEMHVNNEEKKL